MTSKTSASNNNINKKNCAASTFNAIDTTSAASVADDTSATASITTGATNIDTSTVPGITSAIGVSSTASIYKVGKASTEISQNANGPGGGNAGINIYFF